MIADFWPLFNILLIISCVRRVCGHIKILSMCKNIVKMIGLVCFCEIFG
ncbi:unnamed protein product [Moneuplotes crassus]|uniref:Uncharacterized protein n=1 Tax=Euplotes crassus TaxID=5936 RepID=A0AAD1XQ71_EUPCR|nr:unnamed protein product [Moneuplotes crassus]